MRGLLWRLKNFVFGSRRRMFLPGDRVVCAWGAPGFFGPMPLRFNCGTVSNRILFGAVAVDFDNEPKGCPARGIAADDLRHLPKRWDPKYRKGD